MRSAEPTNAPELECDIANPIDHPYPFELAGTTSESVPPARGVKLSVVAKDKDKLRGFLARLLGWSSDRSVRRALQSIKLAVACRVHLALHGPGDLVPIALALHRRILGVHRPFIVCDPRRKNISASVRSPANYQTGIAALGAAGGGALCVRSRRLPHDFSALADRLRRRNDVLLVVCADKRDDARSLLVRPEPISVPPLTARTNDLPRIVDEYAADASAELGVLRAGLTDDDRDWVLKHAVSSLEEIEKTTLRLIALRTSRSVSDAAERLGMAQVSLLRWIGRRRLPRPTAHDLDLARVGSPRVSTTTSSDGRARAR